MEKELYNKIIKRGEMKLKSILAAVVVLVLIGCTAIPANENCRRYSNSEQINKLIGMDLGRPVEFIQEQNDCSARYTIKDTTFDLYYWEYNSDDYFYTNYNHSMIRTTNCTGLLCDELYEFHYIGPPRDLEVKCINGNMWMNDAGAVKEKKINCNSFNQIGQNNQKTWKCDYNQIIEENCE